MIVMLVLWTWAWEFGPLRDIVVDAGVSGVIYDISLLFIIYAIVVSATAGNFDVVSKVGRDITSYHLCTVVPNDVLMLLLVLLLILSLTLVWMLAALRSLLGPKPCLRSLRCCL